MNVQLKTVAQDRHSAAVRRLAHNALLDEREVEFFERLQDNRVRLPQSKALIERGDVFRFAYIVCDGWLLRHRTTHKGRRQIVSIYLPGDFVALNVNFHHQSHFDITALTNCEVAVIEPLRLLDVYRNFPVLAAGLDWSVVRNFNILSERNVSLGARTAVERILHLLLELWCRLRMNGSADLNSAPVPLTQQQIADITGLSLVHTNTCLAKLRANDLATLKDGTLWLPDPERAARHCDFDESFLQRFMVRDPNVLRSQTNLMD